MLAFGGMAHIDGRRGRDALGAAWGPIELTTSVIPFAAIASRRAIMDWAGIGWQRPAGGVAIYLALPVRPRSADRRQPAAGLGSRHRRPWRAAPHLSRIFASRSLSAFELDEALGVGLVVDLVCLEGDMRLGIKAIVALAA